MSSVPIQHLTWVLSCWCAAFSTRVVFSISNVSCLTMCNVIRCCSALYCVSRCVHVHCVQIKTEPPKEIAVIQQKLVRFVWKFRNMDNRANQQDILIKMYKTLPILWMFKIQRSEYSFPQSTLTSSQSSKFRLQLMFNVSLFLVAYLKTSCECLVLDTS